MTIATAGDDELINRMTAGDDRAFVTLYERYQGIVYRFALLMSGSAGIAEEVTQEVFLALIRHSDRYQPERGALPAYLCGIARNQLRNIFRRDQNLTSIDNPEQEDFIAPENPHDHYARREVITLVRQAVLSLPVHYREVVILCDFHELSYAEAASVVGCPVGTVNSRLHRGHSLMLDKMRTMSSGKTIVSDEEWIRGLRCFA